MSHKSDKRNKQYNKCTISSSRTNYTRTITPKKVLSSKTLQTASDSGKSCSTSALDDKSCKGSVARPKKTTKSEFVINKPTKDLDFCKKCGDQKSDTKTTSNKTVHKRAKPLTETTNRQETRKVKTIVINERAKSVDQYYKNENFQRSTESMHEGEHSFKRISLDTIKELPERRSSEINKGKMHTPKKSEIIEEYFDEELGFLDTEDLNSIKKLKEFRDRNYFECHSAKSRIEKKVNVIGLTDHKCSYRFYLNERLFPVPLSTDHQDNIRCVECHLPLNLEENPDVAHSNGFIQAKIRIGDTEPQDTVMFLPVKDQLIIKERKKDIKKDDEVVYFGVIKLDQAGNSVFNQNLPSNSFALKYQKGYKEFYTNENYRLQNVNSDVIVI